MTIGPDTTPVPLDMTYQEAHEMWCQFARARGYIVTGMADSNDLMTGFGVGWWDALLDELSKAAPPEVHPVTGIFQEGGGKP